MTKEEIKKELNRQKDFLDRLEEKYINRDVLYTQREMTCVLWYLIESHKMIENLLKEI